MLEAKQVWGGVGDGPANVQEPVQSEEEVHVDRGWEWLCWGKMVVEQESNYMDQL